MIETLCGDFKSLMLHLGIEVDDGAIMNDEIQKASVDSDCQSSYSSEESVSEPWMQEEPVQEVVFLDISEEQGCIENHLAEDQEDAPFPFTGNKVELSYPPRYETSNDDSCEQPILDTSFGSDPIYDDSASYSERNEDIDDILSTFEWEVSHQNVSCMENTHLIIDMLNKEHKQVLASWGRPKIHLYFVATKTPRSPALSAASHKATYRLTRSDLWG